uniref:Uncharacterized protein n=1 Tax=Tanacetum cinerariifolium TaxID=118510 RepID=A0A699L5Y8_TANCI|nr:hypothetical protein [Tanacetum cinerariifolium]
MEQEVQRTVVSSSSSGSLNMAFLSFPGSTNEVDTASIQVSGASTPVSTVSSHDNTTNLSDATVYAFLANQPDGEWRSHKNQESRARNQDSSRKPVNLEDTSSKAIEAIDGAGFDWSYMANDEVSTNMAPLKTQYDNLRIEFNKSEFDLATYKRGLASVKEQLVFYKKNEVVFCHQIAVLKRDDSFTDSEITALNLQIEKLKKEKVSDSDEDESKEMVLKFDNVQHKPEQANQHRKVSQNPRHNRTN